MKTPRSVNTSACPCLLHVSCTRHPPSRPREPLEPGPEETRGAMAGTLRCVQEGVGAGAPRSPGAHFSTDDRSSGNRKMFVSQYHVTSVCDRAGCFLRCPSRSAGARRGDAPPRGALEPLGRKRLRAEFHRDSVILRRDALTLTHVLGSDTSVGGRQKAAVAPALRRTVSPLGPAPGTAPGKEA